MTRTKVARGGFFHSDQMRVVEKFTREGNAIKYEVAVEDPEVLVDPTLPPCNPFCNPSILQFQNRPAGV
jgi:hypothetical protein